MTFQIPNLPDATYIDQAEPDGYDFVALAERGTGVINGCAVTAQGSPALFVDVAAGNVVVNGTATAVGAGSLSIVAGEANARFDLIVVTNAGVKSVIKGTASTNPRFPALDPTTYAWLAAVYVRQSVSSIVATDIMDKRITVPSSFQRTYTDGTSTALSVKDNAASKTTTMKSDGTLTWVNSVLKRTADSAMEFATSLVAKAADNALSVLILKARSGTAIELAAQKLLDVRNNSDTTTLAALYGNGQFFADNYKFGVVPPETVVVGNKGDLYVNRGLTDVNSAVYVKTTDGGNTGWQALAKYDPSAVAFTTGVCFVTIDAAAPAGSVLLNGQSLSATAPANLALYGKIGVSYGGTVGVNFNVPDWRGYSPMMIGGAGPTLAAIGDKRGSVTTTMTEANIAAHDHDINDPQHEHPLPLSGFPYFYSPASNPTWLRPRPSFGTGGDVTTPYMEIPPLWDQSSSTGITVLPAGGGVPMETLSPVVGVNWCVRL